MLKYLFLVFILGESAYASSGPQWGYDKTHGKVYGPEDWGSVSTTCKTGKKQSPINIDTSNVKIDKENAGKALVSYESRYGDLTGDLQNNGHAPTYTVTKGKVTLKNPGNNKDYRLGQFHFHFGCNDGAGSEHTINGKPYSGELHLVFFKNEYESIKNAATKPDGLTVIGVFLQKERKLTFQLYKLAKDMSDIKEDSKNAIKDVNIKLAKLVPGLDKPIKHYSYDGSLTTPGCHQAVNWRVLKDPIPASNFVFKRFRKLKSNNDEQKKMCNNFRPTQNVNGRDIKVHN